MDDGYKSELKAAIVASPEFRRSLHCADGLVKSSDGKEMVEAINNLYYASLDFLIAALPDEHPEQFFEQVLHITIKTCHLMMVKSMSCSLIAAL
jgi:hypothetical protein